MSDTSSLRLKVIKIWAYTVPPDREENWGYLNVSFEATTIWTLSDCSFCLLYRMKVDQFIVPYWVTLILYFVCFRVTHSIVLPFERFRASPRDPNQVPYSDQPSFYSLELAETKNAIIITQPSRRLWCRWLSFLSGSRWSRKETVDSTHSSEWSTEVHRVGYQRRHHRRSFSFWQPFILPNKIVLPVVFMLFVVV